MRNDVFIGSNRANAGFSWVRNQSVEFISENSVSYYVHNLLDDSFISMLVMKDTPEGRKISNAIEKVNKTEIPIVDVKEIVDEIFLKKASLQSIKNIIETLKMKYYHEGRSDKAQEIRTVLNIN